MLWFVAKRLLTAIPTLLIVATLTFLLVYMLPGDVAQTILGDQATPDQVARLRGELGLDRPFFAQYVSYLGQLAQLEFGRSLINNQDVLYAIGQRSTVTLTLAIGATVFSAVVGIALGMWAALKGGAVDRSLRTLTSIGMAIPSFWAGLLLVLLFAVTLMWLPANGYTPITRNPGMWAMSLILPIVAISIAAISTLTRQTRASFQEVLGKDFIRSLRASGLPVGVIAFKHGLRNAAIPVITVIGLQFVALLGGAVITETVFALPGIGQLVVSAVQQRDLPVVQGVVIYITVIVLLVNLCLDLAQGWLNPKMRLS
ncbi:binding-protein-dependent transport systems inner membrane component (plasmid) [Ketogulonicigenium vulgare Y25]|uniref:ABC transporter permease protein n=1 Tax=Ketogulonicigenium vulgare (strain WSH-001) TaxID=759362 RepID=F9YBT7_KETVW|nr:ABC transporter permease [Ketogulonicigenium vulgare]ADO44405.1 binding-protein-dependent transport systems inner membrane component [Ketogulonicigenium vulgare Y25]AEM42839.1 ABC transporter permease protein [Ketogulonicigenium vulgare WSH-001]ALJ82733.1 ABC transporter permease [Ketogulonicigenium vulgare]